MNMNWNVKTVYGASVIGILAGFVLVGYAGGITGLWSFFSLWVPLPYVLCMLAARFTQTTWFINALLVLTLLLVTISTYIYMDAILINTDAQGALVFVVVPLLQVAALVVILAFLGIYNGLQRLRKGSASI